MPRELVINCSAPHYSLAARKLYEWRKSEGADVEYHDGDPGLFDRGGATKIWLSVVFSWDAPLAADIAVRYRRFAEVEAGGPGLFRLQGWWERETGLPCKVIEWGGEPYCQPMMKFTAFSRDDLVVTEKFGWTKQKLKDVARFYNKHLWRSMWLEEYKPRKNEPCFAA